MAISEDGCAAADAAFNDFIKVAVPDWVPDGSMWLRKLAGPFLDNHTPLGHGLQHMANYVGQNLWMPLLHLPPATYNFVRARVMDSYRTGIAIGRIYEMARHGETISEEELELIRSAPPGLFSEDDDD